MFYFRGEGERMAQEWAKAFYNSTAWKGARAAYIKTRIAADGGMCETCHEVPGYIVHHRTPLTQENINDSDVTLNFANFKYDCKECHDKEDENHGLNEKNETLCYFVNGRMVPKGRRPNEIAPL